MIYQERLTSERTLALFAALTAVFAGLFVWQLSNNGMDGWGIAFLILAVFFLFYTVNYRVLKIQIAGEALILQFGIFRWSMAIENIADCKLDHLPALKRYGGAGIHFMFVDGRYRASFNFLDYPRLVVGLKHKSGPVNDISFSTRHPEEICRLIQQLTSPQEEAA